MNIQILKETEDFIAVIKPSGVVSEENGQNGLPDLLIKDGIKPFAVHRLDKEVSGVMVLAKTKEAAAELSRGLADKSFKKQYLAVVSGETEPQAELQDLLFHDRRLNKTFVIKKERNGVKKARLFYERVSSVATEDGTLSLVKIQLYTGRTHQIRVQMASRKHPIVGDRKYGSGYKQGFGLFSHRLQFSLKGEEYDISAQPEDAFPWNLF